MPTFPFSPVPMGSPPAISIAESLGLGSSDVDMKQVVLKAPIEKVIDPIQQKNLYRDTIHSTRVSRRCFQLRERLEINLELDTCQIVLLHSHVDS